MHHPSLAPPSLARTKGTVHHFASFRSLLKSNCAVAITVTTGVRAWGWAAMQDTRAGKACSRTQFVVLDVREGEEVIVQKEEPGHMEGAVCGRCVLEGGWGMRRGWRWRWRWRGRGQGRSGWRARWASVWYTDEARDRGSAGVLSLKEAEVYAPGQRTSMARQLWSDEDAAYTEKALSNACVVHAWGSYTGRDPARTARVVVPDDEGEAVAEQVRNLDGRARS
ncbi:hypothetical protein C8R45DRAFT_940536 [Mycena sanguinolenta]|nr:hypothetical protein C8R45DRAFT_940536 [Mycena sanguinolenta]